MPTIPVFTDSANQLPEAPPSTDIRPEQFGRDAAALAQLGGELGEFGSNLMTARKRAEENDWVSKKQSERIRQLSSLEHEIQMGMQRAEPGPDSPTFGRVAEPGRSPSSIDDIEESEEVLDQSARSFYDVKGSADRIRERTQEWFKEDLKAAPTGDAQRAYISRMQSVYDGSYIGTLQWENKTRAENFLTNLEVQGNADAQLLEGAPIQKNLERTLTGLRDRLNGATGTLITAEDAQKMYRTHGRKYVASLFDGYSQSEGGAEVGLKLLNSIAEAAPIDPETGDFLNGPSGQPTRNASFVGSDPSAIRGLLLPGDISNFRKLLDFKKQDGAQKRLRDINARMNDYEAALTKGEPGEWKKVFNEAGAVKDLNELVAMSEGKNAPITKEQAWRHRTVITFGMTIADAKDKLFRFSPNEKDKFDDVIDAEWEKQMRIMGVDDNPSFAFGTKAELRNMKEKAWGAVQTARNKDPAAYVEQYFSDSFKGPAGGIPSASRIQKRLSIMKDRGFEKRALLTGSERAGIKDQLQTLDKQDPRKATAFLMQIKQSTGGFAEGILKEVGAKEHYKMALQMDDAASAQSVIDTTVNGKPIDAAFKDHLNQTEQSPKEFEAQFSKEFAPHYKVFAEAGPFGKNVETANAYRDVIKRETMKQMITNGSDFKTAFENARATHIDNHYGVIGNSLVPRKIGDTPTNMEYISGAMAVGSDPEKVMPFLQIPKGLDKDPKVAERSLKMLLKEKSRWVSVPDEDGNKTKARLEVFIPRAGWVPPLTKDGKPVLIDYLSTSVAPSSMVLEEVKPTVDKVMEAIGVKKKPGEEK